MNVLHVIPSISRLRGGPSQALLELCSASRDISGVTQSVVTTTDDVDGVIEVDLSDWVQFNDVRVRFFKRWSPSFRPLREFAYGIGMKSWLRANISKFDLVHIHALFSYASSMAMQVARAAKVPYIVRPSGLLGTWPLQQSAFKKQCFLRLFDQTGLDGAAALEFTSELEETESREIGLKAPSYILPYGMDFPAEISDAKSKLRMQLGIAENAKVLLFLSRIHPKKGLDVLIDAFSKVNDSDLVLLIAGKGDAGYEDLIEKQIRDQNLTERVKRLGFVTGEYKQLLLQGADLFVLPSFSESFAIAVMEALASGCPVITTPGVPMASIVESHEFGVVSEPTVDGQRTAIQTALTKLNDIDWLKRVRADAPDVMRRNFAWDVVARNNVISYESILAGSTPKSFPLRSVK